MKIKKILALTITVLLIISTFASCRKVNEDDMSSGNVSDINSTSYGVVDLVESNISDNSSLDATSSEVESNASTNQSADNTNTESSGVVQQPTTTNPEGQEIIGNGTKDTPYLETPVTDPNDEHSRTVTTVSIPAGSSVYYNIDRVVDRMFTINNANAKVIFEGVTYTASNGKVSFKVVEPKNYKPNDPISFQIYNTGSTAVNFTIVFSDIDGSYEKPIIVNNIAQNTTHIDALKEETELYYEYIADKGGVLHFYFTETIDTTDNFDFYVQNNKAKTQDSIPINKNIGDDLTDVGDDIYEIEIEVEKGDHVLINFTTIKKGRGYPETNIEWYAEYK